MKKRRWTAMLLALVIALSPCLAMAETKMEYYDLIVEQLDAIEIALDSGNRAKANSALANLRKLVAGAAMLLAQKGEYSKSVQQINDYAARAICDPIEWKALLGYAYESAKDALYSSVQGAPVVKHGIRLFPDSADLSGPGHTGIDLSFMHNCNYFEFTAYAGTLTMDGGEIPFQVYDSGRGGDGAEISLGGIDWYDLGGSDEETIDVFVAQADCDAAEPGVYVGELSYSLTAYWSDEDDNGVVSRDGSILLALTIPGAEEHEVTVTPLPAEAGRVAGAGAYLPGARVTLTPTAAEYWRFVEWRVVSGDVTVEDGLFRMPKWDVALEAVFEKVSYPIHRITSDGTAVANLYDGAVSLEALEVGLTGENLSLALAEGAEPEEGCYFTGEFALNGVSLGSELVDGVLTPVTGFIMPDDDVQISAVQAEREAVTLDFSQGASLEMPRAALAELQGGDETEALFAQAEGWDAVIDLNGSGTPDLGVTEPELATASDRTLTLLPGYDAFGSYSFSFDAPTDRYSPVTFILPAPAFGTPDFVLPGDILTIEASAFVGIAATVVELPQGCASIGDQAFKDCRGLARIRVPDSVTSFGQGVFDGCGTVYVFGAAGSAAETYCLENPHCVFVAE